MAAVGGAGQLPAPRTNSMSRRSVSRAAYLDPGDECGLGGVAGRHDDPADAGPGGGEHHRAARRGPGGSARRGRVRRRARPPVQRRERQHRRRPEQRDRDGEIERRARAWAASAGSRLTVMRRLRPALAGVDDRGADPVAGLVERGVGQPGEDQAGQPGRRRPPPSTDMTLPARRGRRARTRAYPIRTPPADARTAAGPRGGGHTATTSNRTSPRRSGWPPATARRAPAAGAPSPDPPPPPECPTVPAAGLDLAEHDGLAVEGHDVDLARTAAPVAVEDLHTRDGQRAGGDAFAVRTHPIRGPSHATTVAGIALAANRPSAICG